MAIKVKFWGVRGSIACPSPDHVVYGGNTSCVEMTVGDTVLIFDAGTGIRNLGKDLIRRNVTEANIFLTHTHWDHINGFPFFVPAYNPNASFRVMAGHLTNQGGVERVFSAQMADPTFPVPLSAMKSKLTFEDFNVGDELRPAADILIKTAPLRHPNGATAFRVEYAGHSVCYVTDTEHDPDSPDQVILDFIKDADLVIYDSTYTDEEFPQKVGWGHSTWQEGIRLCRAANAKQLALFHHDPDHDDATMTVIEQKARATWSGAFAARDEMVLQIE
ncbi:MULTISPECIES: MBL fold metallo-hydrolase [unclassified Thalassospira]|uniref:MBL fold metallo-hydrolase n=1 Tax=unclassified Thalassospira TaxID=2648997 RepID=UPI000EDBC89F|nr:MULTISPECIES: MBL fold metallo-hydrolase [unclassified Thalassospira]HAI32806.1 MBL fold metallo-hydrolase [Thalassospira sp.]|tara:strand:- start:14663 stop:15487 length:825 start_codon:yes stop_codon:yes gene_type:complete